MGPKQPSTGAGARRPAPPRRPSGPRRNVRQSLKQGRRDLECASTRRPRAVVLSNNRRSDRGRASVAVFLVSGLPAVGGGRSAHAGPTPRRCHLRAHPVIVLPERSPNAPFARLEMADGRMVMTTRRVEGRFTIRTRSRPSSCSRQATVVQRRRFPHARSSGTPTCGGSRSV
jgi:hypothetical protein